MNNFKVGDKVLCWGWDFPPTIQGTVINVYKNETVEVLYKTVPPSGEKSGTWDINYVKKLTKLELALQ